MAIKNDLIFLFPVNLSGPICGICRKAVDEAKERVVLGDKGINAIIRAHEERKDNAYVNNGDVVHKICRIRYVNKFLIKKHMNENKAENEPNNEPQHKIRSGEEGFDMKKALFILRSGKVTKEGKEDATVLS